MKSQKADKEAIATEVNHLIKLKEDYKQLTGELVKAVRPPAALYSRHVQNSRPNASSLLCSGLTCRRGTAGCGSKQERAEKKRQRES